MPAALTRHGPVTQCKVATTRTRNRMITARPPRRAACVRARFMPTPPHQYADDAPITSPDEDRFSRAPFAERIAHVFATRRDSASLVVGIYGPWGDGKSS